MTYTRPEDPIWAAIKSHMQTDSSKVPVDMICLAAYGESFRIPSKNVMAKTPIKFDDPLGSTFLAFPPLEYKDLIGRFNSNEPQVMLNTSAQNALFNMTSGYTGLVIEALKYILGQNKRQRNPSDILQFILSGSMLGNIRNNRSIAGVDYDLTPDHRCLIEDILKNPSQEIDLPVVIETQTSLQ
jgi:hypothetical protein